MSKIWETERNITLTLKISEVRAIYADVLQAEVALNGDEGKVLPTTADVIEDAIHTRRGILTRLHEAVGDETN